MPVEPVWPVLPVLPIQFSYQRSAVSDQKEKSTIKEARRQQKAANLY
jgi:hypothetical protein